jgi:hypothetical protein
VIASAAQAAVVTPGEKMIVATPAVLVLASQAPTLTIEGRVVEAAPAVLVTTPQAATFDLGAKTIAASFASLSLLPQAAHAIVEGFLSQRPSSVVSNDGWDTGPIPAGDLVDALAGAGSDFITVTV